MYFSQKNFSDDSLCLDPIKDIVCYKSATDVTSSSAPFYNFTIYEGDIIYIENIKLFDFIIKNDIKIISSGHANIEILEESKDLFDDNIDDYTIVGEHIIFYNFVNITNDINEKYIYSHINNGYLIVFPNKEVLSKFKIIFM